MLNPEDKLRKIRDLVEHGLIIDGEQHKQWYLCRIADVIGVDINMEDAEDSATAP